jgi:hypothetical protein
LYEPPKAPDPAPGLGHLFTNPGITTPSGKGKNREYSDTSTPPGSTPAGSDTADSQAAAAHSGCDHGVVQSAADTPEQRKKRDELIDKILLALLLLYGPSGGGEAMRTRLEGYTVDQLENLASKTADLSKAAPDTTHRVIPSLQDLLVAPAVVGTPQRTVEESAQANIVERYFERNAELIKGVHWHSIMDDRTTEQCRILHDKEWSYPDMTPIGHDTPWPGYPPIFYNCRSSVMPILKPNE